jgi:glycosyltransferase involved in cell wall biosynthesis
VDTIYEFIPRVVSSDDQHRTEKRTTVRQRLGIPLDEFVVGGCGSLGWRKGSDLFLQIARKAVDAATSRELHFVWVGGSPGSSEFLEFMHDLRRLGLTGRCQLVPCTASVGDYYFAMDVFALTSREDPFPLVMLEAGAASLPVICFENSGGGPEFVTEDAGLMAAYLDIESFVEKLMLLVSNESFCKTVGRNAAAKVERNFTVDVVAPKLLGNLLRYTGQSMGPSQISLNTVSACAS